MKFVYPGWLWALTFLPLVYLFLRHQQKSRVLKFSKTIHPSLWSRVAPELEPGALFRKARLALIALAFVFLALARPQWGRQEEIVKVDGLDIMLVLDVSNSMLVEDVVPSRIKKAKHLIRNLVEALKGDRVGAVAFAASAFVACPLTTDFQYFLETLEILGPSVVTNQGTDIGIALETALQSLERGAEEGGDGSANRPDLASKAVVLISDGEDQEQGALDAARMLKSKGIRFYTLGVGTEKGGPIPVRDESGVLHGHKRHGNETVVSSFDPKALMQVASVAGGKYWSVTPSESELEELLGDLGKLNRSENAERRIVTYQERYQWPLAVAVFLFFLEFSMPARKILRENSAAELKSSRPDVLASWFFASLGLASLLGVRPAHAVPMDVYLENQEGLKLYQEGKLEEAKLKFGEAQALNPGLAAPQFNQGVTQLQQGDTEAAIRNFSGSAAAANQVRDSALSARSFYNLGAAFEKNADIDHAIGSYLGAITSAKAAGDAQVETDARKKIEILVREQQKKDQEKQDQKQNQDQKNEQGQSQQDKQDKKDQAEKKDEQKSADSGEQKQQDQQKQYQDPTRTRQREFKSKHLSKEDAERVMADLGNRERELQAKLKRQQGRRSESGGKDW